ncbi:prepilin peptidase [Sulfitobacter sp. D35]|uniref:A24 family peptidase n=1 Tax=Sulfitobacter sp. D35 TaxID=3083252 RepID=UPI00296F7193|nr:prepilin peptidase [Sulfitobacter sp. D35]MDW4499967.1 prepilin peptidase [Sulfitobacter sp. D35]
MPDATLLPLIFACPLILLAAWIDLREMRIPDGLVVAGLAIFVLTAPFVGIEEALWRLVAGTVAFALCFVLFGLRVFGGGDAKFFPVLVLYVPHGELAAFLAVFGVSMAACMIGIVGLRQTASLPEARWKSMQDDGRFPMGTAFAMTAVVFLLLQLAR